MNTDQNAELDFWINPETINTTTTEIWAKAAIPSSGTTVYVYYGNSSATSASSGADTFEFFDDFESYTIGALSGQGGWENTKGSTMVVEEDSRKMIQIIAGNLPRHSCNFGDNYERAVNVRAKNVKPIGQIEQLTITLFDGNSVGTAENEKLNGYVYIFYGYGNQYHRLARGNGSSAVWLTDQVSGSAAFDTYYNLEARWLDADNTEGDNLKGIVDGTTKLTADDGEYTSRNYLGLASWWIAEWLVDRIYVRKCSVNEPVCEITTHSTKPATNLPLTPTTQTTSFEYDDYNKLTEITFPDSTTEILIYDDNGQLVKSEKSTGETTNYEWNDQGMLVKVILPTGEPVEYFYDGNQRLISRKSSDGVDNFVQSGWDIVTKMDDVGKRTYYTGSSAVESEDSVKYFHYNHRGDTVLVTDSEGNTLNNFSYEAYGKVTNSEGIPVNSLTVKDIPNLFVGASGIRYDTKTNLHYMRFRWFSPSQLRFISPDLLMDLNRYAYVSGNPISFIDPLGLWIVTIYGGRIIAIPEKYINKKGSEGIGDLEKAGYHKANIGKANEYIKRHGGVAYDITKEFGEYTEKLLADDADPYSKIGAKDKYNCWDFAFKFLKRDEYKNIDFTDPNYQPDESIGLRTMRNIFRNPLDVPTGLPPNRRGQFDLVIFYYSFQNEPNSPLSRIFNNLNVIRNYNGQWNRFTHFGINMNLKNRSTNKDYILEKVGPGFPLQIGTVQDARNRCKFPWEGREIHADVIFKHL